MNVFRNLSISKETIVKKYKALGVLLFLLVPLFGHGRISDS